MYIISLFSGAGGLDLGFESEGFKPVVAYDIEVSAVETYNHNRKYKVAQIADLSRITGEDIISRISSLQLDQPPCGVVGGPPCQYFSNGNKSPRDQDDPRRTLPSKYADILKILNKKYNLDFFIFENVPGITYKNHQHDFFKIKSMFEEAGFRVVFAILDAYDYGVPQFRRRVFLVGLNNQTYPDANYHFPPGHPSGLTVRDTIGGLPEPQLWTKDISPDEFPAHPNHWTMNPISSKFKQPLPTNMRRSTRSFRRLEWDQPSYTVAYGHNEIHIHPEGHRRLSIYEAMLLQGFPYGRDGYELLGTLTQQVKLVSDAVPPPLARFLAHSIRDLVEHYVPDR